MGHEILGLGSGQQYVCLDGKLKGTIHALIGERFRAEGAERIEETRQQIFGHGYLVDDPRMRAWREAARKRHESCARKLEGLKTRFRNHEVQLAVPAGKVGLIRLEVDDFGGKGRVVRLAEPAPRWLLVEMERHVHRRSDQVLLQFWLYSEEKRRIILLHEHEELTVAKGQDWSAPKDAPPTTSLRSDFFSIVGELFGPDWPARFEKLFLYQDLRECSHFPNVFRRCEEEIGSTYQLAQERRRTEDQALAEKLERKYGLAHDPEPVALDFQAGARLILAAESILNDPAQPSPDESRPGGEDLKDSKETVPGPRELG